jgi:hypothetical protein
MTRAQRAFHRMVWPALGLIVALGVAAALYFRKPPPPESGNVEAHGVRVVTLQ